MTVLNTIHDPNTNEVLCILPKSNVEIARIRYAGNGNFTCVPSKTLQRGTKVSSVWNSRLCFGLEAAEYYALMIASEYVHELKERMS